MIFPVSILLLSIATANPDYPWAGGVSREMLIVPDVVAIVEAQKASQRTTRQLIDHLGRPGDSVAVRTTAVRALSGKGVLTGSDLTIVSPLTGSPIQPTAKDRVEVMSGKRYLVLGFKPAKNKIVFTSGLKRMSPNDQIRMPELWALLVEKNSEVGVVMLFPTTQRVMPDNPAVGDVMLAIVNSLSQGNDDGFRRVYDFLRFAGPKRKPRPVEWMPSINVDVAVKDEVTKALEQLAMKATAYQKSKIWSLLLTWRVDGSKSNYVRALQSLVNDPNVYVEGSGDDLVPYFDSFQNLERLPRIPTQDWLRIVVEGRNPTLVAFFLRQYGPPLERKQQAKLAQRLLDPNLTIRIATAYALSLYNNDPLHRPAEFYSEDEAAACIRYWIEFYGVDRH